MKLTTKTAAEYRPYYNSALGAILGMGAGAGVNAYQDKKLLTPYNPLIGGTAGALIGYLAGLVKEKRRKFVYEALKPEGGRIAPGIYVAERPLWGDKRKVQDIPLVGDKGRHTFIAGIFDKKPEGIDVLELPNKQYATTISGYAPVKGPYEDRYDRLYISLNGDTGNQNANTIKDERSLRAYVDPKSDDWYDDLQLHDLGFDSKKSTELIKKIQRIAKENKGKPVNNYSVWSPAPTYAGNCNTAVLSLLANVGIDKGRLPRRMGGWGGVFTNNPEEYKDLIHGKYEKSKNNYRDLSWLKDTFGDIIKDT